MGFSPEAQSKNGGKAGRHGAKRDKERKPKRQS
jgi:hypothetical protein